MKKAFTLVELLVVMAIMAILTVVTVSQFRTARKRANDVARKGDLGAVAKALQMYFADYGEMPDMENGQLKIGSEVIPWGGEFKDATGYVYMKTLPEEKGGAPYCYKTDSTKKYYALFAALEIGMDGQCDRNGDGSRDDTYECGGNNYCFAYVSPNTSLNDDGSFK